MNRALTTLALTASLCLATAPAQAQRREFANGGVSQLGGQVLPGRSAIATGGLYPGLWFQFTTSLSRRFDLGFRGDLYYASPLGNQYGAGTGFSLPMRLALSQTSRVSVALKLAPSFIAGNFEDDELNGVYCRDTPDGWRCWDNRNAFYRGYDNSDFGLGMGFEIGVLVGIPVKIVNIIVGITSPIHLVFYDDHDGGDLYIPVAPFGGAEIRLTDKLNVFGMAQPGVTFHSNGHGREMEGYFRFWAGIELALGH